MSTSEFTIGQTVSHYRLLSKLGEGGMGVVYAAEDTNLCRDVAVKFLNTDRNKRLSRARFLREARSASILNHPNIATVYDYGETENGSPFIVMELLRGQTLADLLQADSLDLKRSLKIIESVLEALSESHRQGIVHRDIKPSNIAITEKGLVKVLDFGLAKSLSGERVIMNAPADVDNVATQTFTGVVLGTPLYVSPEQATGTAADRRSDLFSVGAVLYECITGRPAFAAPSVIEIFAQVVSATPPAPPSQFNSSISPELDRIALKALSRTIENRYQSAEDFLKDLRLVEVEISEGNIATLPTGSLDSWYRRVISWGNGSRQSSQTKRPGNARTTVSTGSEGRRVALVGLPIVIVIALVAMLIGLQPSLKVKPIDSIAVVPFVNESRDDSVEYLSDGFTDSLIASLSQLPDLKVISRNSVVRYKGQAIDPTVVGTELNVGAILTGRYTRTGDDLHISVELMDTRDRSFLWGAQYDTKMSDVLSVQEDITQKTAGKLNKNLSTESKQLLSKNTPHDPRAYELYIKGRWYWNKRTGDGLRQALQLYQQAIDLDPSYALPYAGLADAYVLNAGWAPIRESHLRAKAATQRALELDSGLGEAHATLGFIKAHYEREWPAAQEEFKRAIELNPNHATAHHWYGDYFLARGEFDQALQEFKRARELDPLSPIINTDIGLVYFYTRQYDLAIGHFRTVADLFPDFFQVHHHLAWAYLQKGMYQEAIEEFKKAQSISKGHTMVTAMLGYAYAVSGNKSEARKILKELEVYAASKYVPPYRFAVLYTGLGEKDLAFQWLNKSYDDLDILLIYVNVSPFFDSLRQDPRFDQLLRRLRLTSP